MPDQPQPPVAEILRRAGYDLPAGTLADLGHAHALLQTMLARLAPPAPEAEPATVFRPEAPR
ncbi:hypothetical protein [Falsiroseomonas oryziterrae]|uniref:hypothetical protein n=1 Tax=Falsiroseomonas oryziterrae TaxID=2911368 RepID=UPI001F19E6B5|nr:hypothetical protein [Roseomonas sp. NPKOSM-4]